MSIDVVAVGARTAHAQLGEAVAAAKHGNPLAPVTVVVPTNAAGVTARRQLGRLGGVAAIEFVTLQRLAERLAGPGLRAAERLPISIGVLDLAVAATLAARPNPFSDVAGHPSTIVAVRDVYRQLRSAGPSAFDALAAASRRGRELVATARQIHARLAQRWYDEADLLAEAVARLTPAGERVDPIVVFVPQAMSPLDAELLVALDRHTSVTVLVGLTGLHDADRDLVQACRRLGATVIPAAVPATSCPTRLVSVTDADEEARHAVRAVVDAARRGIPLSQIAVLWPADQPYARLVQHHLDLAGIAWNGRPGTPAIERLVPRFLLDLLDVDRRGLRRTALMDLLADVPVRDGDGRPAPVALWERLCRDAGVVSEDHWTPRLRRHADWLRRTAADTAKTIDTADTADTDTADTDTADTDTAGAGTPAIEVPAADAAERLLQFVADLRAELGPRSARRRWADWADWAARIVDTRLGPATLHQLDEPEFQAWEHTIRVLDRIRHLDVVSGPATRTEFRDVFAAEFDVAPGRLGRIGAGVTIGALAGAAGLAASMVIVVGAAEGTMPPAPTTDPLLSDHERRAASLPGADAAADRAHRQFLAVLAAADEAVVLTPRGDLRATTERHPSRWLADITPGTQPEPQVHASHISALLHTPFPSHLGEHRLRANAAAALASTDPTQGWRRLAQAASGDVALQRSLALRAARRSNALTVFDGDLSAASITHFEHPVSPTQLEAWAACPHAYFVRYLLGVKPIDDPADAHSITPADKGSMLHETLDRFHRQVIAGDLPQPGPEGWTEQHAARLMELLAIVAERYDDTGRTGRAAAWALEAERIVYDLRRWFVSDAQHVAARRAHVIASEHAFGVDGSVTLPLADGRRLAVRGVVDRIDRTSIGLVVTDHKSGSSDPYRNIDRLQPTGGGVSFQLPAYAIAALRAAGAATQPDHALAVHTEYSFFERGNYRRVGYTLDADVWQAVADDLTRVVSGIEAGWFPSTPAKPKWEFRISCAYCQPDALGTTERYPEWERKRHDPRLAAWFGEPDQPGAL